LFFLYTPECTNKKYPAVDMQTIQRTISDCLRAMKDAERKKIVNRGQLDLLKQIDSEDIQEFLELLSDVKDEDLDE
jgi:hypothetical protein